MKKFRDSIIGSVLILGLTCLVIVLASAFTNRATAPIIEKARLIAAEKARLAVLPAADTFIKIEETLSANVNEAYQAANGTGYVFEVKDKGFGGEMVFMVGINPSGVYEGVTILTHTETPGLGTKVAEQEYLEKYIGISSPDTIDGYTSATVTSGALKRALKTASAAFATLTGTEIDGISGATGISTDESTAATGETSTASVDESTAATGETSTASVDESTAATVEAETQESEGEKNE